MIVVLGAARGVVVVIRSGSKQYVVMLAKRSLLIPSRSHWASYVPPLSRKPSFSSLMLLATRLSMRWCAVQVVEWSAAVHT